MNKKITAFLRAILEVVVFFLFALWCIVLGTLTAFLVLLTTYSSVIYWALQDLIRKVRLLLNI